MRSIIFILLLPFTLSGQASQEVPATTQQQLRRWRVGFSLQSDNGFSNPYLRTGLLILPRVQRQDAALLVADYQVFRSFPALRLSSSLGYYNVTAGNQELRWLAATNWPGQPFIEQAKLNYLHLGIGLLIEPFAQRRFSPYLGWQMQFVFPDELEYSYQTVDGPSLVSVDNVDVTGGEQATRGWMMNFGLRAHLHPRWTASVGIYHAFMEFQADWPTIDQRPFIDRAYMRLDGGGLELRCQFSI